MTFHQPPLQPHQPLRRALLPLAILAATPALAQSSGMLEEVVVTAQKRAQSLQDTPIAITAFGSSELEQRRIRNIGDLAAMAPNVKIAPMPSNTAKATISIRGAVTSNPAITWEPTVGIYLDGIFVGKYSGNVFNVMDLERIEVLRGPQGTLYGKNTIGGAINLSTARPDEEFGGSLRAGYGKYRAWEVYGSVNLGSLDLNQAGSLKSKITLSKQKRDGLYKNKDRVGASVDYPLLDHQGNFAGIGTAQSNPVSRRDHNELDTRVGRLDLLWELNDALELRYVLDKVDTDNTPAKSQLTHVDPDFFIAGMEDYVLSKNSNAKRSPADFDLFERFKSTSQSLFADYQLGELGLLGDVTVKYLGNHRKLDYKLNLDLDGTSAELFHSGPQKESYRQRSHELQFTGATERVDYVAGLYHFKEDADVLDPLHLAALQTFSDNRYGFDGKQYAAFGQIEWRPGAAVLEDRLTLTAGLRWTREKKKSYIYNDVYDLYEQSQVLFFEREASKTWNNTSAAVVAAWDLTEEANVYAKYAEGFKAGGFNNEANNAQDFDGGYNPEKVKSYELGLKSRWLDQRLQVNAATFYNRETSLQQLVFSPATGGSQVTNAGKSVKSGAEIEVMFRPTADLQLSANYGYLHARFKSYYEYVESVDAVIDNKRDKANQYAPRHVYNLGAEYTFAQGSWGAAQARLDYSYQDDHVIYTDRGSNEHLKIKGYGLLNGRLALVDMPVGPRQHLQLALWGKNLRNKDYRVGGIPMDVYTISYFGDPQTFGAEAILTF